MGGTRRKLCMFYFGNILPEVAAAALPLSPSVGVCVCFTSVCVCVCVRVCVCVWWIGMMKKKTASPEQYDRTRRWDLDCYVKGYDLIPQTGSWPVARWFSLDIFQGHLSITDWSSLTWEWLTCSTPHSVTRHIVLLGLFWSRRVILCWMYLKPWFC